MRGIAVCNTGLKNVNAHSVVVDAYMRRVKRNWRFATDFDKWEKMPNFRFKIKTGKIIWQN